ncbi:uncharacterized protein G2W53_012334 [Senna tora]|uniref:Uncharacterized protein n=1 Tax=Senna tora TaxID=362788 RepID=A0A834WRS9_9FABA|nr:uncharacterized protein G2W53_012334 [Senna tora]
MATQIENLQKHKDHQIPNAFSGKLPSHKSQFPISRKESNRRVSRPVGSGRIYEKRKNSRHARLPNSHLMRPNEIPFPHSHTINYSI